MAGIRRAHRIPVTAMNSGALISKGPQIGCHEVWAGASGERSQSTPAQVQREMWQEAPKKDSDSEDDGDEEVIELDDPMTPEECVGMQFSKTFGKVKAVGTVVEWLPDCEVFAVEYGGAVSEREDISLLELMHLEPVAADATPSTKESPPALPHPNGLSKVQSNKLIIRSTWDS